MNAFHRLSTQFSSMDAKIEEQDLALLLLTSHSPSYDCLVTIMLVGKETLKLEEVTIFLYRSRCSIRINNFDYGAFMVKSFSSHGIICHAGEANIKF